MSGDNPEPLNAELVGTADRTIVAALVASVAAASPAVGLAVGVGVPALEHALEVWRGSQARRVEKVLGSAAGEAGMAVDALLTRITQDERALAEMAAAVNAASRTALDAKIDALGRSLGALATDSARIDPEALWIRILSDLEPLHVRVLIELQALDPERPGHLKLFNAFSLRGLADSTAMVSVVLLTLERHGLAQRVNTERLSRQDIARWGISTDGRETWWMRGDLAVECLDRLGMRGD